MSQSQNRTEEKPASNNDLKPIYVRSVVASFGSGAVGPFLSPYAVKLGASPADMSWFQSVSSLAPNMMQIPWGKLSDKLGRRIPFILAGGLISSLLWVPLMFVTSATQLIAVIAVQAFLGSMAAPALTALVGSLIHSSKRGVTTATINRAAMIGSLLATVWSGYVIATSTGTLQQTFFVPLLIALVCGIVSSVVMILIREKPNPSSSKASGTGTSLFSIRDVVQQVKGNANFVRFTVASCFFGFFMSMSWPLFSITTVDVLNASMLEIAVMSVIEGIVIISLQPWGGKLVDRVGRKQLIIAYRVGLVLVPAFYALSTTMYHLYASGVIFGLLVAFGDVAIGSYLLDITREDLRATFTAFYNLVVGTCFFLGSLAGGYLATYLVGIFGLVLGSQLVYAVSAVGRLAGGLTFTTLKEPYTYPSTLKKELRNIVQRLPWMPERGPTQE